MTQSMNPDDDKPLSVEQARQKLQQGLADHLAGKNPGSISFRLKRTKKPGDLYSLKLTPHQRESIRDCCKRLAKKLKDKLQNAGEETQVIGVTRKELDQLNDEVSQAYGYARSPHKQRLDAVMRKVAEAFAEDYAGLFGEDKSKSKGHKPRPSGTLFQFKITLLEIKPPIWRRIQVTDCTLDELHEHIQTAMGWTNSHLHDFEIKGKRYGDPDLLDDGFEDFECIDSLDTLLSDILPKSGKRFAFKYQYDFGDSWDHEILFEGRPKADPKVKYPICLEGQRACPPEDCGGTWGYDEFLEAIRNPKHPEHANMLEWCGEDFDPDKFDPKQATKEMKKGLPDWREME